MKKSVINDVKENDPIFLSPSQKDREKFSLFFFLFALPL